MPKNKHHFFVLLLWTGLLAATVLNCTWMAPQQPARQHSPYFLKIKQWQEQIKTEGWSAAVVDEILNQSRSLTHYEMDFGDDWQTPGSFIRSGFRGDCEDIAIFMMGTLKRLNYPYKVRVLVIEDLFADHAQLKVQMPDGCWRWYESTRRGSYSSCPHGWRPVVEFDENAIVYYAPAGSNRIASSP